MKTTILNKEKLKREEHVIDATDKSLGRLATEIAVFLMGKNRIDYTPHVDAGGFVEINNLSKLKISSKKEGKKYYRHSGYPKGLKTKTLKELWEKDPKKIINLAVRRMLPVNRLRKTRLSRLSFK